MEKYKEVLKKRNILFSVLVVFGVVMIILHRFDVLKATTDSISDILTGFQLGLLSSLSIVFSAMIFKYSSAIKDTTKLKKLYNAENDERRKTIKQKSGGNVLLVSSIIFVLSGIIAGYYNEIIFYTLIACAAFQLNLQAILKLYFSKKY